MQIQNSGLTHYHRVAVKGKAKEAIVENKQEEPSPSKKSSPAKSPRASSSKPKVPAAFTEEVPAPPGEQAPTVLLQTVADLYLYDQSTGLFMTQEKKTEAKVLEAGRFLCEYFINERCNYIG
jgi:hypothetical protein